MQHAGVDSCRENARSEMKKRKVSAFYTGLFGFTSIFFLVLTTICVWIFICSIKEATDSEYGVVFVLALLPVVVEAIGLFLSLDRKSTRLNSSHSGESRMPSSA